MHQNGDDFTYRNEKLKITCAKEPTNILWENKEVHNEERLRRRIIVVFTMIIFTFIYIFLVVGVERMFLVLKYVAEPPNINCSTVEEQFGDQFKVIAYLEMKFYQEELSKPYKDWNLDNFNSRTGGLSCFCKSEKSNGVPSS